MKKRAHSIIEDDMAKVNGPKSVTVEKLEKGRFLASPLFHRTN
jgi:hypothetical protein